MKFTVDGKLRVSPSELKASDMCMRQYFYKYVVRYYPKLRLGFKLCLGRVMHVCAEKFARNTPIRVEDAWKEENKDPETCLIYSADEVGVPLNVAMQRMLTLYNRIKANIVSRPIIDVERRMEIDLDSYHKIYGFVDMIREGPGDTIRVEDWKFSTQTKSANDALKYWQQFTAYKFMAEHEFKKPASVAMLTGSISVAGKPKEESKLLDIPIEFNYDDMFQDLLQQTRYLTDYVMSHSDMSNPEVHYPKTGRINGVCSYCDYADICNKPQKEQIEFIRTNTPTAAKFIEGAKTDDGPREDKTGSLED